MSAETPDTMIKIIATFVFIYLIFRIFVGWVLPALVRWYVNSYRKRFYRENPRAYRAAQRNKADVDISYTHDPGVSQTDRLGEYVDFEDVQDNTKSNQSHGKN